MTVGAVALAVLAAPAAAQAATYTVQAGAGACGAPDLECGTLANAATAVNAAGPDTVNLPPGTYNESPILTAPDTTISGTGAGVVVTGGFTFNGSGGGASTLTRVLVVNPTGSGITVNASYGLTVSDAVIVGGAGNGITITAGHNRILRSQVFGPTAVDISSTSTPLTTTLESTILAAAGGGIGLKVETANAGVIPVPGTAADQIVNARHITIAGSTTGMRLDATQAAGLTTAVGDITVNTFDSIVLGDVLLQPNLGLGLLPANSVTAPFTRTDTTTPSGQLFINPGARNFHLRPDAPVIGQGQTSGGESATDVDGDDRAAAPTDLGADEFVNKLPTARIAVKNTPRDGRPTEFDASGSKDPEGAAGGGIVAYLWSFGDGSKQTTATPTVSHTYKGEGTVTASLAVVDRQNAVSAVDSTQLKIVDGKAPSITITKPKSKQKINLITRKTKTVTKNGVKTKVTTSKRTPIRFAGTAKDKSGVGSVFVTVEKISTTASGPVAQGRQSSATKKCTWLDPKKGLRKARCSKPIVIKAKLASSGAWTYNVSSKIKLSKGGYRVIVVGIDKAGNFGNSAAKSLRNVQFTLK